MGTPLGEFIRAKRDVLRPEDLGIAAVGRRRAPGLRRTELAERAGISVEYLTRIEQGRDRAPSWPVINAICDALRLDAAERRHAFHLATISGGACVGPHSLAPASHAIRPTVLEIFRRFEPEPAVITNRLGDLLARTSGFDLIMAHTGLLEPDEPNLTRYVFTDPRARDVFPDWEQIADEQAFSLWLGPTRGSFERFRAELAPLAGPEFTSRLGQRLPPPRRPLRTRHPVAGELRWNRETLELSDLDAQQIVTFLPADEATTAALRRLRGQSSTVLRAV